MCIYFYIYIHHLHIKNLKMMGFIPKMVTIRIAKFMLGAGLNDISAPLRGGSNLNLGTIQHSTRIGETGTSAFFSCKKGKRTAKVEEAGTCRSEIQEHGIIKRSCKASTVDPHYHFLNLTYHLLKSTYWYHVWIFEPDAPSHTTHAWYIYLHLLWFLSSPKVSWPLNTDPCYTGLNPSIGGSSMILREALNMQPAEELQLATAECSKADHWDPLSNPVTWIYRFIASESIEDFGENWILHGAFTE